MKQFAAHHIIVSWRSLSAFLTALLVLFALGLLSLLVLICVHSFFHRDPDRFVEPRVNSILSAADGIVFSVEQIGFSDLPDQPGVNDIGSSTIKSFWNGYEKFWVLSVFMSVLDVHVNRSPVTGRVMATVHRLGTFRPLFPERKEEHKQNERNTVIIKNDAMTVLVVQIAGHLARKIECWVHTGDFLKQGDRIGWIRMGSRVDLVFPALEKLVINAEEGFRVKAGIDSLATLTDSEDRSVKFSYWNASKTGRELRRRVLTKLMIWALYGYAYGKIGISILTNTVRKKSKSEEQSVGT